MGRHRAPEPAELGQARNIDIERVQSALYGLGFDSELGFDRLIISAHDYVATAWIDYSVPLSLVIDSRARVPMHLDFASALAEFLDTWNMERIAPSASYELSDAGTIHIHTRSSAFIKCGLSDNQLQSFLGSALHSIGTFYRELRAEFELDDDHLRLPTTIVQEQDHVALNGPHPQGRHLPAGEEPEVYTAPDLAEISPNEPIEAFEFDHVVEPLDQLDFSYAIDEQEIVSTAVNGVGFALCVDSNAYFRITGGWITDFEPENFLDLWLVCNDHNEKSVNTTAYTRMEGDTVLLHVETSCDITQGQALDQRSHFVISSLVAILGAMDSLSTQTRGHSIVEWPS
ncbi:YbjN domain-containing protein [Corynebacterium lubricantis]|uniref:YbjN domain-containing protein n=1 Tax=Corynebacterium lubricantis TaxID=541095 RepID=UPI0003806675|nr:YbjN domain-containing protein [Corynebacterium lubricantis]